jgi:hypothetical protein
MKTKAPRKSALKAQKRKPDDPQQFERFVETARRLGVDERGEAFDRAFDKIVSTTKVRPKP